MFENRPILMYHGKETVHFVWNILEMWRAVIPYIDRLFTVTKLGNIGKCCIIQSPKSVFVESFDAFLQANFNAIGQKVVLPQQVLLLDFSEEFRIVCFANGHEKVE